RLRHRAGWSGRDLVTEAMDRLFDALDHDRAPIHEIVRAAGASASSADNPLFRTMFSMHDSPLPRVVTPGLRVRLIEGVNVSSARFDLDVVAVPGDPTLDGDPDDDALTLIWDYSTEWFAPGAVELLAGRFEGLLSAYLSAPDDPVRALVMDEPAADT